MLTKEQRQAKEKLRKSDNNNSETQEIKDIPLDNIITDFENVRTQYVEASIIELAESIERYKLLQPITVLKVDDKYKIIAGHRRFKAYHYLFNLGGGKPTYAQIPAIVKSSIKDIAEVQLIENIQRENLSPADLEQAVNAVMKAHKLTQEQAAKRLGKSQQWVNMELKAGEVREFTSQLVKPEITSQLVNVSSGTLAEFATLTADEIPDAVEALSKEPKPTQKAAREIKNKIKGKGAKPNTPPESPVINSAGASLREALAYIQKRQGHLDTSELKDVTTQLENIMRVLLTSLKGKKRAALIAAIKKELSASSEI